MNRIVLLLTLVVSNSVYCQVDSARLDSLAKRIASDHKRANSYQDSFLNAQNNAYRTALDRGQKNVTGKDTSLLAGKEQNKKRFESRSYIRPGIAVLLLFFLVIGLLRLRKKSKQS